MHVLTVAEVVAMHDELLRQGGGEPGLLHRGALDAAVGRAASGPFLKGNLIERAALLLRGIAQDHPFADGNKRTVFEAAATFLDANGVSLDASDDEVVAFMLACAQGHLDLDRMMDWLRRHARFTRGKQ